MASHLETRMARIEAVMRRLSAAHHRHVVHVAVDADDINAYLDGFPCVCGAVACELKTFGLIVPQPLTSEAWQQHAHKFYAEWPDHAS